MGAGIDHGVSNVGVRQVWIICLAVESKLQHPCPRHVELVAERADIRRDQAQILSDEREYAQFSLYRAEEISARPWHPLTGLGRRCPGRDMPGGREPTEMIHTNHIHVSQ